MNNKEKFGTILEDVQRDAASYKDVIVPFSDLRMNERGNLLTLSGDEYQNAELSDFALTQLFTKTEMPVRYMKKLLKTSPGLVADQFNYWSSQQGREKTLLLRGILEDDQDVYIRGVLSDKYSIMDNKDILENLIEIADEVPDFDVVSVYNTDKKLHIRLAFPGMSMKFGTDKYGKNDVIRVGLDIQNSEIGYASLMIAPITYRLVCTNGLRMWKVEEGAFKQRHVHVSRVDFIDTMRKTMLVSVDKGKEILERMGESRKVKVARPNQYIDRMVVKYNLSGKVGERVKEAYAVEPEKSVYGIVNGFTRAAQEEKNHDARIHLETIASDIMVSAR